MIFRNDDISSNTNLVHVREIYDKIKSKYPTCRIISGVTLFSRGGIKGSVYDDVPFKNKPLKWFYDVDSVVSNLDRIPGEIAAHGTLHVDHTKLSRDAQEMSILTACNYLQTKLFIPPFNKFNDRTLDICVSNNIDLISGAVWKSLEFNKFDSNYKFWYFHSWRYTINQFKKAIYVNRGNLGFVQTNAPVSA